MAMLFALVYTFTVSAQNADTILGKWINANGEGQILICKNGDKYFGKLAWMKEPNDAGENPKLDALNPDKTLQSRPKLGIELLKDLALMETTLMKEGLFTIPNRVKLIAAK